jgi:hypothetical protein
MLLGSLAGWRSFALKRSWALWDNVYDVNVVKAVAMVMVLREFGLYVFCL